MTHGSWFSAASGCGRIRSLGVYEVMPSSAVEEEMDMNEFGWLDEPLDSSSRRELSALHYGSSSGRAMLQPVDGEHQTGSSLWPSSIPTALIAHEWGQKGISLTGKELVRHVVYRLTAKELELCRVQIRGLVRRRLVFDAMSYSSGHTSGMISSVSRRSSSASSVTSWAAQGYRPTQRQLPSSGSNFSSLGRRLEQISASGTGHPQGRRGHKHSSSMSSVPNVGNRTFDYHFQHFGNMRYKHHSVTWADQYARSGRRVVKDRDHHDGESLKDLDDYVLVWRLSFSLLRNPSSLALPRPSELHRWFPPTIFSVTDLLITNSSISTIHYYLVTYLFVQ